MLGHHGAVHIEVSEVRVHPNFNPFNYEHDIALVRFRKPVRFSRNLFPVCLPPPPATLMPDGDPVITDYTGTVHVVRSSQTKSHFLLDPQTMLSPFTDGAVSGRDVGSVSMYQKSCVKRHYQSSLTSWQCVGKLGYHNHCHFSVCTLDIFLLCLFTAQAYMHYMRLKGQPFCIIKLLPPLPDHENFLQIHRNKLSSQGSLRLF